MASSTSRRQIFIQGALRLVSLLHLERFIQRFIQLRRSTYPFTEYFRGLDKVEAVKQIFGERTVEVLGSLRVEFIPFGGYMWVDGSDGHLVANSRYLREGDRTDIYLDLIHELVHVKQFSDGMELFDSRYDYVERPTELDAYRHAVNEARRLGLSDLRICNYLLTEWMSRDDLKRLAEALNVNCEM